MITINALRRAILCMQAYEELRATEGEYPSAKAKELLARAKVYAEIAQAQHSRDDDLSAALRSIDLDYKVH